MEEVLYNANPPILRNNPLLFVGCIGTFVVAGALIADVPQLILAVLAANILLWLFLFVLSKSHRLVITRNEVRYERGILAKDRTELGLQSVRSIRIDQTFFQRILGVATVEFFSAGDVAEIHAKGMPNPHRIRELVDG